MHGTAPFLRFVLYLGAGILVADLFLGQFPSATPYALPFFSVFGLLGLLGLVFLKKTTGKQFIGLFAALFCLGGALTGLKHHQFVGEIGSLAMKNYDETLIEITSLGQRRKTTYQYEGRIRLLGQDNVWEPTNTRVLVSIADKSVDLPQPGEFIIVKGREFNRPNPALNPNQMNYGRYLMRRGIAWTMYLPTKSFKVLDKKSERNLAQWPARVSQSADSVLREYLAGGESYGLVKAMLLGRRDDLGPDLQQSYASAGAIHVLAVSGLHVGVLFLLVSLALGWLKKWRWGRVIYVVMIVLLLGGYALVTGLSPSVVRASLMCVVLAISQGVSRKHHSLNALALSAFIILLLDPMSLFTVGFQLSYAAVAGILLIYPLGRNLFRSKLRAVEWLWQITLIGFSAQLFTFPISVYYFHQFPAYFWLVNPFVILLTSVLIYSALGVLLFGSFVLLRPLAGLFTYWTEGIGSLMNQIVALPGRLPGYLWQNLNLSLVEVVLMMFWLLILYKTLKNSELKSLKFLGALSLLFFSVSLAQMFGTYSNDLVLLHATPKHTVLSITHGQTAYILADSAFAMDQAVFDYNLKNYFNATGILTVKYANLPAVEDNTHLQVGTQKGPIRFDAKALDSGNHVTVIRNKRFPNVDRLPMNQAGRFVLSQELGFKTKEKWRALLESAGCQVVDPAQTGAQEF